MGKQDFARIEVAAREPEEVDETPMRRTTIWLLIVLAVVVVMGAFAAGFWLGHDRGAQMEDSQGKARLEMMLKKQEEELANLRALAKRKPDSQASTSQVGELTFYNELPMQSVKPSALHEDVMTEDAASDPQARLRQMIAQEMLDRPVVEPVKTSPSVATEVEKNSLILTASEHVTYHIQVASFQMKKDALIFSEKLKAQGFNAEVQQVELPKLGQWHRVYMGNYTDMDGAKVDLQKVKETMNVTGLIVRRD